MIGLFILLICFLFSVERVEGFRESLKLAIYDNNGQPLNRSYIMKNVDDTLILVCKIKFDNGSKKAPKLSWILPSNKNRPYNTPRPHKAEVNGMSVRLVVEHLQDSDIGQYQCVDKSGNKNNSAVIINLIIKDSFPCGKGVLCGNLCILERFTCDGFVDCQNGKDESVNLCGPDPCHNKIRCPDGRCIPKSWCCNSSSANCTKKWDIMCCPKIGRGSIQHDYNAIPSSFYDSGNIRTFREYSEHPINYVNNPHHYTDLNFLQTAIYAVFGCAILFMLIVTILVVIMQCKLQMRRNWQFQLLNRQRGFAGNNTYHRDVNQEDILDMVAERYDQRNRNSREQPQRAAASGGLLVTYNINNGVQIVGKPIEPPPYTEVAPNPPLNQGPPPPYSSSDEGQNASSSDGKSARQERHGHTKVQASSEPDLSNIT